MNTAGSAPKIAQTNIVVFGGESDSCSIRFVLALSVERRGVDNAPGTSA